MNNENLESNNVTNNKVANINNILAALIIAISFIVMGISGSYAYFLNQVVDQNTTESKKVTVTSGDLQMTFATESDKYINVTDATLINDTELLTKGTNNYTEFSVTLPSTSAVNEASYLFYLTDFEITDNFKNDHVKWALFEEDSSFSESTTKLENAVAYGDFSSVVIEGTEAETGGRKKAKDYSLMSKGNPNVLLQNFKITKSDTAKKYRLYIWLSNDPENNQKSLLNGSLSAKVGFVGTTASSGSGE